MQTALRRRRSWATAASVLTHLGVLTVTLLQHPTLNIPNEPGGPPLAIIPLLILPRTPAALAGHGRRPAPIQLHRRPQRNLPAEAPVAPVILPARKPTEALAPVQAPTTPRPSQTVAAPSDAVRATLKTTLGCTEGPMMLMSRDDRAGCQERLGRGAKDNTFAGLGLNPEKLRRFDAEGARKEADNRYKHSQIPGATPDTATRPGETAEQMKQSLGVAGHTAVIPF